jgi:hypothetical protein
MNQSAKSMFLLLFAGGSLFEVALFRYCAQIDGQNHRGNFETRAMRRLNHLATDSRGR